jgi:hypothetical protein
MPRGNRSIVPGNIYHLTHRCHDREFLLRFACDRDGYRRRLREAVIATDLSLLTHNRGFKAWPRNIASVIVRRSKRGFARRSAQPMRANSTD